MGSEVSFVPVSSLVQYKACQLIITVSTLYLVRYIGAFPHLIPFYSLTIVRGLVLTVDMVHVFSEDEASIHSTDAIGRA